MKRKLAVVLGVTAVVLAVLVAGTATRAEPALTSSDTWGWKLTGLSTISPGQVIKMEEGVLIQGIVIQGQANGSDGSRVSQGTFRLTYDIFTPRHDMPGQKAGVNYVVGDWTITRAGAPAESIKARHSPDVISGRIKTELQFSPTAGQQAWAALATLPMSPAAGRWGRGQGSLSFDARGTGSLTLGATLLPASGAAH